MLDLNTIRRLQSLAPSYMNNDDNAYNPLNELNPNQSDALAFLQNQQPGQTPPADMQVAPMQPGSRGAPQIPIPQATYDGSPISGLMPPPGTSAGIPQARIPDVSMNAGGLMPNAGAAGNDITGMTNKQSFPFQYLGPSGGPSSTAAGGTGNAGQMSGLMPDASTAAFEKLMDPANTPIHNEYTRLLMHGGPNRADYNPSKMRRFGAIMAGFTGQPGAYDRTLNAPFNEAAADYQTRLKNLQQGDVEEEKMISNKRGIATAQAMDEIRSRNAELVGQKMQFAMEQAQREYQRKTSEFEATQARLYAQLQSTQITAQQRLAISQELANNAVQNTKWLRDWHNMTAAETQRFHNEELAKMNREIDLRKEIADARAQGETVEEMYDGEHHLVGIRRYRRSIPGQNNNQTGNDPGNIRDVLPQAQQPANERQQP